MQPNNFDFLRLFAAAQVVLTHSVMHLGISVAETGAVPGFLLGVYLDSFHGVPIFFVTSGFLISAAWERNPNIPVFARNRALRIFPGMWFCIAVTVLTASLFGFDFLRLDAAFWAIAQAVGLIYTPEFLSEFGFGSYNGSLWTIPLELQFYVIVPVIYLLIAKGRNVTTVVLLSFLSFFFIALVYRYLRSQALNEFPGQETLELKLIRYTFIPHVYMFFFGVLLQRLNVHKSGLIHGKAALWIAGYLLFHYFAPHNTLLNVVRLLFLGVCTISIAYTLPELSKRFLGKTDISYGIYIYHGLLLNIFVQLGWIGGWDNALAVFALTILCGFLSWIFVEKPCVQRKKITIRT